MDLLLQKLNTFVWGIPTILLILATGFYFTVKTGFCQFSCFGYAFRSFAKKLRVDKNQSASVSPYQALCTALAATVGTGNIAGVAGAISLGGPGSIFWMWICAFLGMIIKCAEATLAVRYRIKTPSGELYGGPMIMIDRGLGRKWRWLGTTYAAFGVVAAFGVGNATQINAVLSGIHSTAEGLGVSVSKSADLSVAFSLALLIYFMLSGGAKRIGRITEMLVPFAAIIYIILGLGVLLYRSAAIPEAFSSIFTGAFSPHAVTGGLIGSMFISCRTGAARGVFTNEAGMGTASIAHASADVKDPVEQGMLGIIEVFLDTIVICTVTALVILCSGVHIPYGTDTGAALTADAFSSVYGSWVSIMITACLICFAVATVIGWGFYGLRCAQFLFGEKAWRIFIIIQAVIVVLSTYLRTGTVWTMAEIVNGLMAVPNLIMLLKLSPEFFRLICEFKSVCKK